MPAHIMLIGTQMGDLQPIKDTLSRDGYNVIQALSGTGALKQIETMMPDLNMVILDVELDELNCYEVCRCLRRHPDTVRLPILALTSPKSPDQKNGMFEAGADDCVSKPCDPSELLARVKLQLRRSTLTASRLDATGSKCRTFAVFSLRGGVGVTTLAANLAVSLSQLWNTSAVLVDLVLGASQGRSMFNLQTGNTWAELVQMPVDDIDDHVLDTILLQHESGVSIFPAPRVQECREPLDGKRIRQILSLLRARFRYVVMDVPHDFQEGTVAVFDEADKILSVMVPEVASLANQHAALEAFQLMNFPQDRVHVVLNRIHERDQLEPHQIEDALKRPLDFTIPFADDAVTESINLGEPLTFSNPRKAVSAALEDFAFDLSHKDHPDGQPTKSSQAWHRTNNRGIRRKQSGLRRLFSW